MNEEQGKQLELIAGLLDVVFEKGSRVSPVMRASGLFEDEQVDSVMKALGMLNDIQRIVEPLYWEWEDRED